MIKTLFKINIFIIFFYTEKHFKVLLLLLF